MTPAELIENALREHMHLRITRTTIEHAQRGWPIHMSGGEAADAARIAIDALAGAGEVVVSTELLEALTDPDECWFDHHGGCQAHGFLSLEPGERCPQAVARELLAALPERTDDA